MKKYFILLLIMMSFVVITKVNAEILYPNMQATITDINNSSKDPYGNAKIVFSVDNENFREKSYSAVYAKSESALKDSFTSAEFTDSTDILISLISTTESSSSFTNYSMFIKYEWMASLSGNVYVAIYKYESGNYLKVSSISEITRPDALPLTKRIYAYFLEDISAFVYELDYQKTGVMKTFNFKIGRITDKSLLNNLKKGTGINTLLNYAKNDSSPLYTKSVQYENYAKYTNDLNKSLFVPDAYYYVYVTRDSENGKYIELEDVNIYQYKASSTRDYVFLYDSTDSRFVWQLDEETIDTDVVETVTFETETSCSVGESLTALVKVSNTGGTSVLSGVTSSDTSVANVTDSALQTNCTNCKVIDINCVSAGTATITATTSSGATGTVNITVIDGIEEVELPVTPVGTMYTLTYNSNGGKACSPNKVKKLMLTSWGELCTPTKKGYDFAGWYTAKNGGTQITSDTIAESNLTVYAQWIKNPQTGISTPVIALMLLTVFSSVGFFIIRKKGMNFN